MTTKEVNMPCVPDVPSPRTILDLGAYDGVYSKPFVRENDTWILVDNKQWLKYGWGEPNKPANAMYVISDIMDYDKPADIVICSNVLYHVTNPYALLKHLYKLTNKILYLKTYFNKEGADWTYYGKNNPQSTHTTTSETIFWRPTINVLIRECESLGFKIVETLYHEKLLATLVCIK